MGVIGVLQCCSYLDLLLSAYNPSIGKGIERLRNRKREHPNNEEQSQKEPAMHMRKRILMAREIQDIFITLG